MESYLRVNLLGLGPRLMKKRIYRVAVLQKFRNNLMDETHGRHNVKIILRTEFKTDNQQAALETLYLAASSVF